MKFSHWSFSLRLALQVGGMLAITVAISALAIWRLNLVNGVAQHLTVSDSRQLALAIEWSALATANLSRTKTVLSVDNNAITASLKQEIEATSSRIDEIQKVLTEAVESDEDRRRLDAVIKARSAFVSLRADLTKRRDAGENVSAPIESQLMPAGRDYVSQADDLRKTEEKNIEMSRHQAEQVARSSSWIVVAGLAVALLLGLIGAISLMRSLRRALAQIDEIAERIAQGDLGGPVVVEGPAETARVMRSIATMQTSLRKVIGDVRSGVESVGTASREIAQGNFDLSGRTEQQASSLQQTAASMEEMTGTIKQSADNAKQANQLANSASEVAARGGAVVASVVERMSEIQASSKKIAEIITVIDGIAFQTNILALNAAVEAARAGEQGRGFAVVAGEVRNLAQRSAQAAREIKSLISDSVEKVESGSKLVNDAGQTMSDIVSQVKRVTDLIGEITAATMEQSTGIGQVNQAVSQLDQMTQQNAALVEQSTAAAQSLKEQSDRLAGAVAVFRLSQSEAKQVIAQAQSTAKQALPLSGATPKASAKAAVKSIASARSSAPVAPSEPRPLVPAKPAPAKQDDNWEEF